MIKKDRKNVCREYAFRIVFGITTLVLLLTGSLGAATEISECENGNLTIDGGNYALNGSISSNGTCISILANNITIDGAGYKVNYSQSKVGYGVNNTGGYDNITIKNLTIVQGNYSVLFAHAIYADGMISSTITNNIITTSGNGSRGIELLSSDTNIVSNNIIANSAIASEGIRLESSNTNTFSNNTITTYGSTDILLVISSNGNIFSNNTASTSDENAIVLASSSSRNTFSNNTITSSGMYCVGVRLVSSSNMNNFTSNKITTSGDGDGFYIEYSDSNIISGNMVNSISAYKYGIYLSRSSNNIIYNNYFNSTNNAWDDGNNYWNITKQAETNIIGGPYLGGNYWSDYAGNDTDGDRLGNTLIPYNSSGNITYGGDYLPLTIVLGVIQVVGAGSTVTTDTAGTGTSASNPVVTNVTTPNEGTISIQVMPTTQTPPTGFYFLGQQVNITAPPANTTSPLNITFRINSSLPNASLNMDIFKNGVLVPICTGISGEASPDPCVSNRALLANGDIEITVLTSTASAWNFGIKERLCHRRRLV